MDQKTAAVSQLIDAIRLCREGRFASALTLAGAAEEILPPQKYTLYKALTSLPLPESVAKDFADDSQTARARHFNGSRNWLKHHIPGEPIRTIDQYDAELMIVRAIDRLHKSGFDVNGVPEIVDFRERYIRGDLA